MKKIILFNLLFFLRLSNAHSQNYQQYDKTRFYELIVPTYVAEVGASSILAQSKLKFTLLREGKDSVLIQFWTWGDTLENKEKIATYNFNNPSKRDSKGDVILENGNTKVFKMSLEDFKNNAIPYFNAGFQRGSLDWSSGLVVLPVKARNAPLRTYSKDLSLGLSGGGKWRISHRNPTYLNLLLNVGISSVSLDSVSTGGRIKQPSDRATLTTAIGLVFENHSFQFGFFYGWDRLSANDATSSKWIYDRKPWLSFGIGYQLFSAGSKSKETKAGTQ
ncbi:MAG: hypothetical protein LCH91_12700 [Bacteroidetes bacterium]|nr:hypothetical protein [Bacteroidota bacterium]